MADSTTTAVSPLRRRMIDDMMLRNQTAMPSCKPEGSRRRGCRATIRIRISDNQDKKENGDFGAPRWELSSVIALGRVRMDLFFEGI